MSSYDHLSSLTLATARTREDFSYLQRTSAKIFESLETKTSREPWEIELMEIAQYIFEQATAEAAKLSNAPTIKQTASGVLKPARACVPLQQSA